MGSLEAEEKISASRPPSLSAREAASARVLPRTSAWASTSSWRAAGLALLLFSATIDHYTLSVAGLHIKAEHVVALGLFVVLVVARLRAVDSRPALPKLREWVSWPFTWLVPYLGITLLSSTVNSPDVGETVKHTAMIGIVALSGPVVYWLAGTTEMVKLGVKLMVLLGLLESAYTFVALVAANFGSTLGVQPGSGHIIVPYGTLWEPNLLGSYLAASGVLLFSFLFIVTDRQKRIWLAAGLTAILTALALSLARAAWVGVFVGAGVVALLYFLEGKGKRLAGLRLVMTRALVPAGLALAGTLALLVTIAPVIFPTTTRGGILVRVNPAWYDPAGDVSLTKRVNTTKGALDNIISSPIIGNGAGSYGLTHTDDSGAGGWISNLELHILYDSGIMGLLAFVLGIGYLIWCALWALFRGRAAPAPDDLRPYITGLLGAMSVLLFAFQATEGTWMAFFWVYVGLLARVAADDGRTTTEVGSGQWAVDDGRLRTMH